MAYGGNELVDLRTVINYKRQSALGTNVHIEKSNSLQWKGNKDGDNDMTGLTPLRPQIDYLDLLDISDDISEDNPNTDCIGGIRKRSRHSMFVEDEELERSTQEITGIGDKCTLSDREKETSSELREEGDIYGDRQREIREISRKRKRTDSYGERESKRRRDSEIHNVNKRRSYSIHKSSTPDRKIIIVSSDRRSPRSLKSKSPDDKYLTQNPRNKQSRNNFIHLSEKRGHKTFDFVSKTKQYENADNYLRNQKQSSLKSSSRNKSNRRTANQRQNKDNDHFNKANRAHVMKYGSQTELERRDRSSRDNKDKGGWKPENASKETLNLHNNVRYRDREYCKKTFLSTMKYLSRPCQTNDIIANILALRSDVLSQCLLKEDKCPEIRLFIDILVRCAESNICTTSKHKVMYILKTNKFFERNDVIDSLKQIRISPSKDCEDKFLLGLLSIMKTMIDTVNLQEDDTTIARSLIESIIKINNENATFQRHNNLLKDISERYENKLKEQRKSEEFRGELFAETLPILPDIEIIRQVKEPDIPKYEIGQKFDNDRQYISHMFVLFREDFIRPLCKGIRDYISYVEKGSTERFRSTDVRLFQRVMLLSTDSNIDNGTIWTLQLEVNFRKKFYIPGVLQYGSLICLSPDQFSTMCYATVVNRDYLQHGIINIKFLENNNIAARGDETFVMLESRSFYEAYSHTLSMLKELALSLKQGKKTLPFGKYLLGTTSNTKHPKYLEKCRKMSFNCLTIYGQGKLAPINSMRAVNVQDLTTWPSSDELGLDTSQYKALKLALTNEISLIQGPPGTGKTTMGIRIAEFLLFNKRAWRGYDRKPMLLVSYTNHALDQFLQLLVDTPVMAYCLTEDVVRVGSRCEIENLEKFTLKSHRKIQKPNNRTFRANYAQLKSIERDILELKSSINFYKECLVHEKTFRDLDVISSWMYDQLVEPLYSENIQPMNKTSLWIWLDIPSLLNRKEQNGQKAQPKQFDYVPVMDIVNEDVDRKLDDDENEWVITIMPQDNLGTRPIVAIDDVILRTDPYYQDIDQDRIKDLMEKIETELFVKDQMTKEETERCSDIWRLSTVDRWKLYRYWVFKAIVPLYQRLRLLEIKYDDASRRYREARELLDCKIMKNACIVAMTTTAAARYTHTLQEVAPPVVIIEEAAQVSEQHVLGVISSACQHLIMIGDHQQLRPAYNDYNLARTHHTDVSLFERLIRTGICYQQLDNQHRMRPEISALLVPHIYKCLENHESVFKYSDIKGVATNLYFVAHEVEEDNIDESLSHSNKYEVEYISKLYRHLRLQGYFQNEITILSLYKDQVQLLRKKIRELEETDELLKNIVHKLSTDDAMFRRDLPKTKLENNPDVRITAVDNFQGEENRIILLSLVRSNKNRRIGYLNIPNRVCVALSRAREGLYVIGNMTCLRQASDLWEKIISKAETQGLCGKHLELKCLNHKENKMIVETPQDFDKYKDGGCHQPCKFRMKCGHKCSRKCHNDDPDHNLPCKKVCEKYCVNEHCHEKLCYESIGICREEHEVTLPRCGHAKVKMCFQDVSEMKCDERCYNKLTCGHICQRKCGEICNDEDNCQELVKITGKCGHECQIACSHQKHFLCKIPCARMLDCGHPCSGTCGKCHQGRLHIPCKKKCERILICGHPCRADCTEVCPPCTQMCTNKCEHSKCMYKCGIPCTACREPCQWECRRGCRNGFKCTLICSEDCNRTRCNQPCRRIIPACLHKCIGLKCEKCICRECNAEDPFEIFFGNEDDACALFYKFEDCGHIFELSGLDQYMDERYSETSLGMKVCPRCKTPILVSKRYGNVIKECRRDIDAVKRKIGYHDIIQDTVVLLRKAYSDVNIKKDQNFFASCIRQAGNKNQHTAINNQINFYVNVTKHITDLDSHYKYFLLEEKRQDLLKELHGLREWTLIKRFRFSEQELSEFKLELTRVRLCLRIEILICSIQKTENVPQCDNELIEKIKKELNSGEKLTDKTADDVEIQLRQLENQYPHSGLGISDDEKIMVLKAMGFSQKGHWYKCKNGHIYAIGECGGAMAEGKCPECKETIGGSDHRLRDDNQLASEMDGAQFPAWSDQANMQNYDLMENEDDMP